MGNQGIEESQSHHECPRSSLHLINFVVAAAGAVDESASSEFHQ